MLYSLVKTSAEDAEIDNDFGEWLLNAFKDAGRFASTPLGVGLGALVGGNLGAIPGRMLGSRDLKLLLGGIGAITGGTAGGLAGQHLGRSDLFKENYTAQDYLDSLNKEQLP